MYNDMVQYLTYLTFRYYKMNEYEHIIWRKYLEGKRGASLMTRTLFVLLEDYPPCRHLPRCALPHQSNAPHFLTLDLIIWKITR